MLALVLLIMVVVLVIFAIAGRLEKMCCCAGHLNGP